MSESLSQNVDRPIRDWPQSHRTELRLCLRITVSAVLTLLVSHLFHLRLALWAVLTAVILTQMSVGRSVKATTDYLAGTLGGAIFAGAVGTIVPHDSEIALVAVLAIALVPVAFIAAENPRFSVAPFTAVIVLLAPTVTHLGPITSAFERVIEVAVGCIVGVAVSLVVLPARAYDLAIHRAARVLGLMAQILPELFEGLTRNLDEAAIIRLQDRIGDACRNLDAMAAEGRHERIAGLAPEADLAPLSRTLLRLRHDFVMIGRTAVAPLPVAFQVRLGPELDRVSDAMADYLHATGSALAARRHAAPRRAVDAALDGYAMAMGALRHQDLTRDLSIDAMERIFTLAFALEQLRRDFDDLDRCVAEHSESRWQRSPRAEVVRADK
jgi:uncharacterized membrane protein YccC